MASCLVDAVIIKSTQQYEGSGFVEYSEAAILQMIGRAGRPQAWANI
jgi:replicative superfamily II helicase